MEMVGDAEVQAAGGAVREGLVAALRAGPTALGKLEKADWSEQAAVYRHFELLAEAFTDALELGAGVGF